VAWQQAANREKLPDKAQSLARLAARYEALALLREQARSPTD
jgi:hypothetical protein